MVGWLSVEVLVDQGWQPAAAQLVIRRGRAKLAAQQPGWLELLDDQLKSARSQMSEDGNLGEDLEAS